MTRLLLVRHGESNATVERVVGGPRGCTGLSPLGAAQARALAERFRRSGPRPDRVIASTMPRAVETAEPLAAVWDLPITRIDDLREHDPGPEADGMSFDAYRATHGNGSDWYREPYLRGFEGGETVAAFHFRTALAAHRLVAEHPDETLLVVCHGGVIDVMLRSFLGLPEYGSFLLYTTNTSITELHRPPPGAEGSFDGDTGMWRLLRYNDAAHLDGLDVAPGRPD